MNYQYTSLATEFGIYYVIRVADRADAAIASGKDFRAHFAEEVQAGSFAVVYRDQDGQYEFFGSAITDLKGEELDRLYWAHGEWLLEAVQNQATAGDGTY